MAGEDLYAYHKGYFVVHDQDVYVVCTKDNETLEAFMSGDAAIAYIDSMSSGLSRGGLDSESK